MTTPSAARPPEPTSFEARSPTPRWEPRPRDLPPERVLRGRVALEELRENVVFRRLASARGMNVGSPFLSVSIVLLLLMFGGPLGLIALALIWWRKRAGAGGGEVLPGLSRAMALDLTLTLVNGRDMALAHWARQNSERAGWAPQGVILVVSLLLFWLWAESGVAGPLIVWWGAACAFIAGGWSGAGQMGATRAAAQRALKAERNRGRVAPVIEGCVVALGVVLLALLPIYFFFALLAIVAQFGVPSWAWLLICVGVGLCVGLEIDRFGRINFNANLAAATQDFDSLLDAIRENGPLK